ncbi:MAG: hypothetical protein WBF67_10895 [Olleya sp.]
MKKTILLFALLLISFYGFSQDEMEPLSKKNELSSNLFDLVIAGSFNVNYERYLDKNQSLFIGATFFDTYAYYDSGNLKDSNAISIKAAYIVYFSKKKDHAGFFFYPQAKFRTGTVTVDNYYYYDFNDETTIEQDFSYDVDGFSLGFGLGHKWVFNDKFTLGINAEIARNLGNFDDNYLDNVEPRFGIVFGVRF